MAPRVRYSTFIKSMFRDHILLNAVIRRPLLSPISHKPSLAPMYIPAAASKLPSKMQVPRPAQQMIRLLLADYLRMSNAPSTSSPLSIWLGFVLKPICDWILMASCLTVSPTRVKIHAYISRISSVFNHPSLVSFRRLRPSQCRRSSRSRSCVVLLRLLHFNLTVSNGKIQVNSQDMAMSAPSVGTCCQKRF